RLLQQRISLSISWRTWLWSYRLGREWIVVQCVRVVSGRGSLVGCGDIVTAAGRERSHEHTSRKRDADAYRHGDANSDGDPYSIADFHSHAAHFGLRDGQALGNHDAI